MGLARWGPSALFAALVPPRPRPWVRALRAVRGAAECGREKCDHFSADVLRRNDALGVLALVLKREAHQQRARVEERAAEQLDDLRSSFGPSSGTAAGNLATLASCTISGPPKA